MDENKTEENKNNLISIGKGIILSSPNNNTLPTPRERKSRREEPINIKKIKSNNSINLFRNSNMSSLNATKKSQYSNLSKLNYKDGLILKDATNSNPGFGLWSIKLSQSMKNQKKINEKKIFNNRYNIYNNNLKIDINEEINNSISSNNN